jgi:hypothetical protein
MDLLAYADGTNDLVGISDLIGVSAGELYPLVETLLGHGLLAEAPDPSLPA